LLLVEDHNHQHCDQNKQRCAVDFVVGLNEHPDFPGPPSLVVLDLGSISHPAAMLIDHLHIEDQHPKSQEQECLKDFGMKKLCHVPPPWLSILLHLTQYEQTKQPLASI
tara:strand:+ start:5410 stop:5736 length:327 start_codon:yes stop_codon:yes gene_type:complete